MPGPKIRGAEKAFSTALDKSEHTGAASDKVAAPWAWAKPGLRQAKVKEASATGDKLARAAPNNSYVKSCAHRGRRRRYGKAGMLLEDVLARQPGNSQARTLLGMVNMRQGNLGQAEMVRGCRPMIPATFAVQRLLAETRSRLESPQKTLESLKPALEGPGPVAAATAGRPSLAPVIGKAAAFFAGNVASGRGRCRRCSSRLRAASSRPVNSTARSSCRGDAPRHQQQVAINASIADRRCCARATRTARSRRPRPCSNCRVTTRRRVLLAAAYAGRPAGAGRDQLEQALKRTAH
jgi:hypothetical protein